MHAGGSGSISLLACAGLLSFVGCGGNGPPAQSQDLDGAYVSCDTDTRAAPYQAGMSVVSESGAFTVRLLSSLPGPPVKGQNNWLIEVDETASGTPLDGLDVTVTPFMPDHQHPTTRPVVVMPVGNGGTYRLNPVYLYMSGVWEVRMNIVGAMVSGGTSDLAVIPICIP